MSAFISYSFENAPELENVIGALTSVGVSYWNAAEIKLGDTLREQLRVAVERCEVCIFIATRSSIASSWCGAELGAFWGAGKPIIVYVAEPSLQDDELPPVVRGDIWERRIQRIAMRAKELLDQSQRYPVSTAIRRDNSGLQVRVEQLERMIGSAVSLAAATSKDKAALSKFEEVGSAVRGVAGKVLAGFQASEAATRGAAVVWHNQVLWVDDRPEANLLERQAMESMGLEFTLALSTVEAVQVLGRRKFAVIISDMSRSGGPREGYVLLEAVRAKDRETPFFIYADSQAPQHRREAALRGAQGTTTVAGELIDMVTRALPAGNQ